MARRMRWYSVSLDTLRGTLLFLGVLTLVVGAFFGYRHWEAWALEQQAESLVQEAQDLKAQVLNRGEAAQYSGQVGTANEHLALAVTASQAGDVRETVDQARRSRDIFASILGTIDGEGGDREANFIAIDGTVELRRYGTDDWEEARKATPLRAGDRVRTSANGSAEIVFRTGTLYTVSPNTSIVITASSDDDGDERSLQMEHGWINLTTQRSSARVATPDAEARVAQDSEAFITYEDQTRRGRIAAVRGSVEVSNESGDRRQLGDLEQVTQQGSRLSETQRLPARPQLMTPPHKREMEASAREMGLSWGAVDGARGYTLQVAHNKLFTHRVIEDSGRRKTSARLGIRGPGNFYWRVAAEGSDQELGPWSPVREFRVPDRFGDGEEDRTPPELSIEKASGYGSIFIVEGQTEAGASVTVNGESVQVHSDGSFTKTIQLAGEGWGVIEIRARDAWGNAVDRRQRVFIDGSP